MPHKSEWARNALARCYETSHYSQAWCCIFLPFCPCYWIYYHNLKMLIWIFKLGTWGILLFFHRYNAIIKITIQWINTPALNYIEFLDCKRSHFTNILPIFFTTFRICTEHGYCAVFMRCACKTMLTCYIDVLNSSFHIIANSWRR